MTIRSILLLGSGNHAEVVLSALQSCGKSAFGCLGPAPPKNNWTNEVVYLGNDDHLKTLNPDDWELINCIGSTKKTALRAQVFLHVMDLGFDFGGPASSWEAFCFLRSFRGTIAFSVRRSIAAFTAASCRSGVLSLAHSSDDSSAIALRIPP